MVEPSGGADETSALRNRRIPGSPRLGRCSWGTCSPLSPRQTTTRLKQQRAASTAWTELPDIDELGPSPLSRSGVFSGWRVFSLARDAETMILRHVESSESSAIDDSLLTIARRGVLFLGLRILGWAADFADFRYRASGMFALEMVLLRHMESSESSAIDDSLLTIASRPDSLDRAA